MMLLFESLKFPCQFDKLLYYENGFLYNFVITIKILNCSDRFVQHFEHKNEKIS